MSNRPAPRAPQSLGGAMPQGPTPLASWGNRLCLPQDAEDRQICNGCQQQKTPDEFGWTNGKLRRKCKMCRAADERARHAANHPPRACSVCGGRLLGSAKLDVCRRTPECLRISVSRHNALRNRRKRQYPPCANCGGDWLRAGRGERLCGTCGQALFWCSGLGEGYGHVAAREVYVSAGTCRYCRLLRRAFDRATVKRVPFDLTWKDVESVWNDSCPYLGIPMTHGVGKLHRSSPTLDRIMPALGYIAGNVEVISHRANTMKCEATPEELATFARVILARFGGE